MNNQYEKLRSEGDFDIGVYESKVIEVIRNQVGSGQVLLALSGGVDSTWLCVRRCRQRYFSYPDTFSTSFSGDISPGTLYLLSP